MAGLFILHISTERLLLASSIGPRIGRDFGEEDQQVPPPVTHILKKWEGARVTDKQTQTS